MLPNNNRFAPHSHVGTSTKKASKRSNNFCQLTTSDDLAAGIAPVPIQEVDFESMQRAPPLQAQPMSAYPDNGRVLDLFLQSTISAELQQQRHYLSYQMGLESSHLHFNDGYAAPLGRFYGGTARSSSHEAPHSTEESSTFVQTAVARLPVHAATQHSAGHYTDYDPIPLNQAPACAQDVSSFGMYPISNTSIEDSKPAFQSIEPSGHQRAPLPKTKTFPSERANLDITNVTNSTAEASRLLLLLGSTLRSKADKFIDASVIPDPGGNMRRATGKELFFPDRLYKMLEYAEQEGLTDVVSFQPHGRSFRVHNKHLFVEKLLPLCLKGQSSWPSFLRQLRLYGFSRAETGPDYGAYYHELFLRSRPGLCR